MSSLRILGIFLLAALVGPALALLDLLLVSLGPAGAFSEFGSATSEVVLLLWPFQVVGIAEASLGTGWAIALAVVANLALFMAIGTATAAVITNPTMMLGLCFFVFVVVFWGALWSAGYQLAFVNWWSLAIALLFYGSLIAGMHWAWKSRTIRKE